MNPPVCLEVLAATIVAWAGVWGCIDELMLKIDNTYVRVALYVLLSVVPLTSVTLLNHVSICTLV